MAPDSMSLATTLLMSHGAMNCPFFTLTGRPVAAAASSRSVCRARNAGIWMQIHDLGDRRGLSRIHGGRWSPASRSRP